MKKVLIHSNFCKAFTGFGKHKKNILRYLQDTGKYELFELANGLRWDDPKTKLMPWECRGSLPEPAKLQGMDQEKRRAEGYGFSAVDRVVKEFKPDVYIGIEDIWAFNNFHHKPWWNKVNSMVWTTLDSLPILPQAIQYAPKIKNYYVWASFAEKAMREIGYDHIKTLRGSLNTDDFHKLSDEDRERLRAAHGVTDEFIIGFVFRNQLRKSVPNMLEGFKLFKEKNPQSKAKLLLHTNWAEGWDIQKLIKEKGVDNRDILTTYVCDQCGTYSVRNFIGQQLKCQVCNSDGSCNTASTTAGVNEAQLNEIYNLMDVYCHPFTSGGQELPIQEAKLAELITLVTNYSCGEDNCTEESAGLPLAWNEYREPGTQFIKASTCPESILERLQQVYDMPIDERSRLGEKARAWVEDNFSIEVIGGLLEDIIDSMPEVDYDYSQTKKEFDPEYSPPDGLKAEELIIDIYKNILDEDVDEHTEGFLHWMGKIRSGEKAVDIINHFKKVATKHSVATPTLEDLLDKDEDGRIAVIIKEGDTDVLLINGLITQLKKMYKKHNIYVFTKPEYYQYVDDNTFIHKLLPYSNVLDDTFQLEGIGAHKGLFDLAFYPTTTTQKNPCYVHNGLQKHQFSLK